MIRGVPYSVNENTPQIIIKLAAQKGITYRAQRDIHCMRAINRKKQESKHPPNIIVTFKYEHQKRNFKQSIRNINIKDIDHTWDENTKIYISENLPPDTRTLFYHTRQHKREHKWAYAWTDNGKVYIRKTTDSPPIQIEHQNDLDELAPPGNVADDLE
jgi:hypothetical protein